MSCFVVAIVFACYPSLGNLPRRGVYFHNGSESKESKDTPLAVAELWGPELQQSRKWESKKEPARERGRQDELRLMDSTLAAVSGALLRQHNKLLIRVELPGPFTVC